MVGFKALGVGLVPRRQGAEVDEIVRGFAKVGRSVCVWGGGAQVCCASRRPRWMTSCGVVPRWPQLHGLLLHLPIN